MNIEQIRQNPQQIKNILKFIHDTQSEEVKYCIFTELGRQCFHATGFGVWLEQYRGKPEEYIRRINDEHTCMYWESIQSGSDGKSYILTGVAVDRCVCSFASGDDTPLSLCNYCCKSFQKQLFGMLFDREVEVEILSSYLKGSDRCSTIIHFV